MDVTAGPVPRPGAVTHDPKRVVYRHSVTTRLTHWFGVLAFFVLVMSGLQIFNAAPYLDLSDKSDPAYRVLDIDSKSDGHGGTVGTTTILGVHLPTTHVLGYGDDGSGAGTESDRAFPGWITLPGYQDLASGRRWHLFFGWVLSLAGIAYFAGAVRSGNIRKFTLSRDDLPKLLPMQLYYFGLRKDPPHYGKYNPLQKAAYTVVLYVFSPLIVLTGLALSPGFDAIAHPLLWAFGGRQFARSLHFLVMVLFLGFFATHLVLVLSTGFWNNMRSMLTGRYRLGKHEGDGA